MCRMPLLSFIGNNWLSGNKNLEHIHIPKMESLTDIGDFWLAHNENLEELEFDTELPNLKRIGSDCFLNHYHYFEYKERVENWGGYGSIPFKKNPISPMPSLERIGDDCHDLLDIIGLKKLTSLKEVDGIEIDKSFFDLEDGDEFYDVVQQKKSLGNLEIAIHLSNIVGNVNTDIFATVASFLFT